MLKTRNSKSNWLGLAFAGLGMKQQAVEHGQKALMLGTQTYANTGDYESALRTLKDLMDTRSLYTLDFLKIDPDLKTLLEDPGFKDLKPLK